GVTRPGVLYSVAGGACVGVATVLGFVIYRLQGPLSAAAPIVMLGALLVTVLVGILALGETMSLTRGAGIVLAAVAIYLLAK
ncbi:MAG TPA: hypothetical protein VLB27_07440, partial [candidate division Zixibacteria bacterium]|nr:hypothetical protein [candidate division Zixibacteria bacterium]